MGNVSNVAAGESRRVDSNITKLALYGKHVVPISLVLHRTPHSIFVARIYEKTRFRGFVRSVHREEPVYE